MVHLLSGPVCRNIGIVTGAQTERRGDTVPVMSLLGCKPHWRLFASIVDVREESQTTSCAVHTSASEGNAPFGPKSGHQNLDYGTSLFAPVTRPANTWTQIAPHVEVMRTPFRHA
jgi:hypothetical protein